MRQSIPLSHWEYYHNLKRAVQTLGLGCLQDSLEAAARTPGVTSMDLAEVFSQENWEIGHNSDLQRLASNGEHGRDGQPEPIDPPTMARIMTSAYETDTIVAILTRLMNMATDLQNQYNRIIIPYTEKLSRGFATLPDELIGVIFKFSVRFEGHNGGRHAKWLSQVSRRFRKVALEDRSLWTTLYSNSPQKDLKLSMRRSIADSGLHVFVDVSSESTHMGHACLWREFMSKFLRRTAQRWKTLTIGRFTERIPYYLERKSRILDEMYTSRRTSPFSNTEEVLNYIGIQNVAFPCLEVLEVREDETRRYGLSMSWTTPQLHSLICPNYLPSPSTMFSSVTSLTIAHNLSDARKVAQLLSFLAKLPTISDLELIVGNRAYIDSTGFEAPLRVSTCTSITAFRLQLQDNGDMFDRPRNDPGSQDTVGRLLNSLRLPNLQHLSISLQLQIQQGREDAVQGMLDLSTKLLSAKLGDRLARLCSLSYSVQISDQDQFRRIAPSLIFTIPFDGIPEAWALTLKTCTQVRFARERCVETGGFTGTGPFQQLHFVGCDNIDAGGLQATVQSLKDSESWDCIGRVSVEFCKLLQYETSSEVIGKDKFHYLA